MNEILGEDALTTDDLEALAGLDEEQDQDEVDEGTDLGDYPTFFGEDPMDPPGVTEIVGRLGTHAPDFGTRRPDFGVEESDDLTPDDLEALEGLDEGTHVPDYGTRRPDFGVGIDFGTREPRFGTHRPDFGTNESDDLTPADLEALEGLENEESESEEVDEGADLGDYPAFFGEDPMDPPGVTEIVGERFGTREPDFGTETPDFGTDGDDELSSEDIRALQSLDDSGEWTTILGEEEVDPSRSYLAERIAASRAMLERTTDAPRMKEWEISLGPVWAPAGRQSTITVSPQCLFRGEKIVATDTGSTAGYGTRIMQVAVGQKIQKPSNNQRGALTLFFAQNALANGINFDTAQQWAQIAVTVSFVESCTFEMSIFGKAVIE